MRMGTVLPAYSTGQHTVPGKALRYWSERSEEIGFDSIWSIDHLVKPHTYETSVLDPIVALSHAAAVTDTAELGTGIVVLPLRRTAAIAKQVLSLQHLAGRQIHLGVGAGYNKKEFEVAGVPRDERGPRLTEAIDVLQSLFASGSASYDGEFHSFDDISMDPELSPQPNILAGGSPTRDDSGNIRFIKPIRERILRTDGYVAQPTQPDQIAEEIEYIDEFVRDKGGNPDSVKKTVVTYCHLVERENTEEEQRQAFEQLFGPNGFERAKENLLVGTLEEIREQIYAYEEAGVTDLVLGPPSTDTSDYETQLDLLADEVVNYVN